MFKCEYCGKLFSSQRGVISHKAIFHQEEIANEPYVITRRKRKDVLDITNKEMRLLKKAHSQKCDVCGKTETANTRPDAKKTPNNLCIDHDHNTNEFRGFLCVQCNRNFGWYDKYKSQIEKHARFENRSISKK